LSGWNAFLRRKVNLVACGGTAMTLLGIKESTKDIDLIVPHENEYKYLAGKLTELGYVRATKYGWSRDGGFLFDLYPGNRVYETELLDSPLASNGNMPFREFSRIYVGILNYYDIFITKLFRSSSVDVEDCLKLMRSVRKSVDLHRLGERFAETASYDVSERKALEHFARFKLALKKEGLI